METGQLINRIDNNLLDSSDSTLPEETEVRLKLHKKSYALNIHYRHLQITSQNLTVQLGGTAFLVCKVPGVDRIGVNWVSISLLHL
jgi:hypothetical protein